MNGDKLTPTEAKTEVFLCIDKGFIYQTVHFKEELANEEVSFGDCTCVIEDGMIFDQAEWDDDHREWKYRLEGYEPDGKWLVIVFSLPQRAGQN